jgi:hypothetical protein
MYPIDVLPLHAESTGDLNACLCREYLCSEI